MTKAFQPSFRPNFNSNRVKLISKQSPINCDSDSELIKKMPQLTNKKIRVEVFRVKIYENMKRNL